MCILYLWPQARRLGLGGGAKQTVFIDEASCEAKCQAIQDCCDNNDPGATFIVCYTDGYCDAEIEDAGNCVDNCGFEMAYDNDEGEGKNFTNFN